MRIFWSFFKNSKSKVKKVNIKINKKLNSPNTYSKEKPLGGKVMLEQKITINNLKKVFQKKGYNFYDGDTSFNLNIIGVRSNTEESNMFDDFINIIYRNEKLELLLKTYPATTDPGKYWLENPMNEQGTAILVPDQYKSTWKIGKHHGKYEALVQAKKVRVWRDNDKDDILDFDVEVDEGYFGINIHRSNPYTESYYVGKWSAGCQVFSVKKDFDEFMDIVKKSSIKFGNFFTYTLITEEDLDEVI